MKICVLASGSKGNCTYFETDGVKCLIDVGPSCLYVERSLKSIGVNPSEIGYVFITHTHSDHVGGLKIFLKKYNPIVVFTEKMDEELGLLIDDYVYIENNMNVSDLYVDVIKTSHDADDSNGYIFRNLDKSFVYVTDTGYINVRNFDKLSGHNLYIMESNHDVQKLMDGRYPYHLKQRILGDKGHLSNKDSAYYLTKFVSSDTSLVILAHLSEENNTPDLALSSFYDAFDKCDKDVPDVLVAKQRERLDVIEL